MKKLTAILCLTIAVLLGSAGVSFALPKCPGSYNWSTWTDCFGTYTFGPKGKWAGDKYVGECQKSLISAASNLNALAMRKRP